MEKKMTKKEMFNLIANAMKENNDVVAFCNHEIELLEKKVSKSGQTKTQKENAILIERVFSALATVGRPVTITELQTEVVEMSNYSNQKLSALLKKLVDCDRVVKTIDKKKSYFSIVTDDDNQYLDKEVEV